MSATRPSREPVARTPNVAPPRDTGRLRALRRQARRRQRLARLDLGLGVLAAIFLLLATPGLAVSALIAILVVLVCGLSLVLERRRRARGERSRRPPEGQRGAAAPRRARAGGTQDRRL